MVTRYVNPDSNGGDGTTSALSGANAAYASLSAAEAEWGVLAEPWHIICDTAGSADTTAVAINGSTTTAANYIEIDCENRHSGVLNTGKYNLSVSNTSVLIIQDEYIRIDGLQIVKTASNANDQACIFITSQAASNDIWISNCICKQAGNASYREPGIYISDADAHPLIWNTIVYNLGSLASSTNSAVITYASGCSATLYNCVLIGGYSGVRANNATAVTAKNCYAYGATAAYSAGGTGTLALTTCGANDTTGDPGGLDNVPKDTTTFVNVTGGSEDFHLANASSTLYHAGTDTSGDSAPLNFTKDIDDQNYYSTRSVGVDEIVSSSYIPYPFSRGARGGIACWSGGLQ